MKILISGGFGFIGSHLVQTCLDNGHEVGVLVRRIPPHFEELSKNVKVHLADISEPIDMDLEQDYDVFVHMAAANDQDSKDPQKALDVNVLGTRYCLEFCERNSIKNVLYFSTFHVYGVTKGVVTEETSLLPRNDYAITHLFAEDYLRLYERNKGFKGVVVRPTNIYGGFLHKDVKRWTLVPNPFCKEAVEKGTITLLSSGKQSRDYITLDEVSNAIIGICSDFDKFAGEAYNLASGNSIRILDMAKQVKQVFEEMNDKPCELVIKSDEPRTADPLTVSNQKLKDKGITLGQDSDVKAGIRKVFELLR